jgi:hypothetical protein
VAIIKYSNGASKVMQTLKLQIFLMRLLGRVKTAFANSFAIHHDLRSPFSLMSADTQKSHFVGLGGSSHVLQIAKSSNLPQICKRVVQLVSINVVNVTFRHVSGYIKPRQSMRQSFGVVDGDRNVPRALYRPRSFSDKIGAAMVFTPSKNARLRVVIQRVAQMLNGNVKSGSHDIQFTIKATQ